MMDFHAALGLGLPIGWVDGKPARVAVFGKVD